MSNWDSLRPALPVDTNGGLGKMEATKILCSHSRKFQGDWRPSIGSTISNESFERKSIKRAHAQNCIFDKVNFSRAAGNGSIWTGSEFNDCKFDRSNFLYSNFSSVVFGKNVVFDGANFSGSLFNGASFDGSSLIGSSFTECNFCDARIHDSRVESCTFEDSKFPDAKLTNLDLANTNIEYVDFIQAELKNIRVSLAQFAYVFGISSQQIEDEKVIVSTSNKDFPDRYLPWKDLLSLIPVIIIHYRESGEEFPYANLMFMSGYLDELKYTINSGILSCLATSRFRDVKYLSKLARISNVYNRDELHNLYDMITFSRGKRGEQEAYLYSRYEGDFRKYLLSIDSDVGIDVSIRIGVVDNSIENLLSWLLDRLERGCSLQGILLRWDRLESTITSPGYLSGRIRVAKEKKAEHDRVLREKASLLIGALGALFGAISAIPTLSPPQQADFDTIRQEIRAAIILESFYASLDTQTIVRLGKDGRLIWPEELPPPAGYVPGRCVSPMGKN
ncbi:pentapeptide repeat-containing protein [Phaeospirillum tilakii]|uniref:Pentapeptide repeat-containing protein n=1 Tax=Phaeospirillum tilakii TaxID=741673 RepID=A0ABW5CF86_9PROT